MAIDTPFPARVLASAAPDADCPSLLVSGATGRLGREFVRFALERGARIAGAMASPSNPAIGRPLRELGFGGLESKLSAPEDLPVLLALPTVYVGCAPAAVEIQNLPVLIDHRVPAVIASTGFDVEQLERLRDAARSIPLLVEPNFSVGVHWIRAALRAAGAPPEGFDVALIEGHRRAKRDRPSATALAWASDLETAPKMTNRPSPRIPIESLRLGGLPGTHQMWIAGEHELVRIEHQVFDRRAFAEGIWRAARWVAVDGRSPGLYDLDSTLDDPRRGP